MSYILTSIDSDQYLSGKFAVYHDAAKYCVHRDKSDWCEPVHKLWSLDVVIGCWVLINFGDGSMLGSADGSTKHA